MGVMPARNREAMRKIRAEWKRDGYCTRCGKDTAAPGGTRCIFCRLYDVNRKNIIAPAAHTVQHST